MAIPVMTELGTTGLRQYSGHVQEEFLREWQGPRRNKIIGEMVQDPTVGGCLLAIDLLLRRAGAELKAADDTPAAEEVRLFIDECRDDMSMSWADTVSEIFTMLSYGWEYSELVYKRRVGDNKDNGKSSKYDDGKIGWRKWPIRSQDSLDRWEFDDEGGLAGMWQIQDTSAAVLIPVEKALLFRTSIHKNNPEGRSILRTAYSSWYYKHNIERIEAIGIERDLAGLPTIYLPPEFLAKNRTPEQTAFFELMKEIVTNIRRDEQEGVIMPMLHDEHGNKLFELTLLTSGGSRQFDTDKVIARYDQRIAISMLADFILLGHEQTGSYALSQTKSSLFRTAIEAWLSAVADVINSYAIPRLLRLNGIALELAPKLCFGKVGEIELADLILFIEKFALAGGMLFPHMETENYLRTQVGLPPLTEEEFTERETKAEADKVAEREAEARQPVVGPKGKAQEEEQYSREQETILLAAHRVLVRGHNGN